MVERVVLMNTSNILRNRFFRTHAVLLATSIAISAGGLSAFAQTESPVQSKVNPLGLPTVGPVMLAASDEASAAFQKLALPGISEIVSSKL